MWAIRGLRQIRGLHKTTLSHPSAAWAQGHMSCRHTAARVDSEERANVCSVLILSSLHPRWEGTDWVAPKDSVIRLHNCFPSQTWESTEGQGMFLFSGQILFSAIKASF